MHEIGTHDAGQFAAAFLSCSEGLCTFWVLPMEFPSSAFSHKQGGNLWTCYFENSVKVIVNWDDY